MLNIINKLFQKRLKYLGKSGLHFIARDKSTYFVDSEFLASNDADIIVFKKTLKCIKTNTKSKESNKDEIFNELIIYLKKQRIRVIIEDNSI